MLNLILLFYAFDCYGGRRLGNFGTLPVRRSSKNLCLANYGTGITYEFMIIKYDSSIFVGGGWKLKGLNIEKFD